MLEAILLLVVAGGGYYWYEHRAAAPSPPPSPAPVPGALPGSLPVPSIPSVSPLSGMPSPLAGITAADLDANMPDAMKAALLQAMPLESDPTRFDALALAMSSSPPPGPYPKAAALAKAQAAWLRANGATALSSLNFGALVHPSVQSAMGLFSLRSAAVKNKAQAAYQDALTSQQQAQAALARAKADMSKSANATTYGNYVRAVNALTVANGNVQTALVALSA
jgi:hypothetical protein